jgi:hypothetical protein
MDYIQFLQVMQIAESTDSAQIGFSLYTVQHFWLGVLLNFNKCSDNSWK